MAHPASEVLRTCWQALGGDPAVTALPVLTGPDHLLPSALPVTTFAQATVAAAATAAAELAATRGTSGPWADPGAYEIPAEAVAAAFVSERHLTIDGQRPALWGPLSGFHRTADGWIRLHGNYPHHLAGALAATGADDPDQVPGVLRGWTSGTAEDAINAKGGIAGAVRTPAQWTGHPHGRVIAGLPLLSLERSGDTDVPARRPLPAGSLLPAAGVRVLDLTRVIAGPVGTRTLAAYGADVLRVDSPRLSEIAFQQAETGPGKRTCLLDLADAGDRQVFERLLADADVLVTGYRPGALARFGLDAATLAERHPGLVVATLSAYGPTGPWSHRRGFDSIVQGPTGLAVLEAEASSGMPWDPATATPGALPAQALDHGTGYLLAAAVLRALAVRERSGGSWHAGLSLAQTSRFLAELPRVAPAGTQGATTPAPDARWFAESSSGFGRLRYLRPPVLVAGNVLGWTRPSAPTGTDAPRWLD